MSRSEITIRPFADRDEDDVAGLWRRCFPDEPPRNEPKLVIGRKRAVQPDLFLVGELDGRVVATAVAGYDGFRGWIYHLATAPEHRRRGIARALMAEVERRLIERGCPKLNLQVRSRNAEVAAFYDALGYGREDHLSFGKELTPPPAGPSPEGGPRD